jgi:hypothetical protein
MAFGGTIHLVDIGVRDFVEADMAILTFQLTVNGTGILLVVDIKNSFGPAFIVSSDAGISMTQQTVFRVGNGIGSKDRTGKQQQKKHGINTGYKGG